MPAKTVAPPGVALTGLEPFIITVKALESKPILASIPEIGYPLGFVKFKGNVTMFPLLTGIPNSRATVFETTGVVGVDGELPEPPPPPQPFSEKSAQTSKNKRPLILINFVTTYHLRKKYEYAVADYLLQADKAVNYTLELIYMHSAITVQIN